MSISELASMMQLKPEHSGINHPLEVNQLPRKANPVGLSAAGTAALLQFYESKEAQK